MKNIILNIFENLFRYILFIVNILYLRERKLILFYCPSSSDNGLALFSFMQNTPLRESLYWMFSDDNENRQSIRKAIHLLRVLPRSKIIVSTHGFPHPLCSKQFLVDLWHGIPYKTLGLWQSLEADKEKKLLRTMKRVNVFCSTSMLSNHIFSSCFQLLPKQLVITGQPRNDLLLENKQVLFYLVGKRREDFNHVVFFMPTFREAVFKKDNRLFNPFCLDEEKISLFDEFLLKEKILWVSKFHMFEEREMIKKMHQTNNKSQNMVILSGEEIKKSGMAFYTILASSDLLVTDYSSVFFDYLLLDKPMVFFQPDASEYWSSRGKPLFSPDRDWLPGPTVVDVDSLREELIKNLQDKSLWADKRRFLNNVINQFQDLNSCSRVFQIIERFYYGAKKNK